MKPQYLQSQEDARLLAELRNRIYDRIEDVPTSRVWWMRAKSIILPLLYFSLYIIAVISGIPTTYYLCFWGMGILLVLIYLNIIHDAAHNNVFEDMRWNRVLMYIFDLVGANSYIWKVRHVYSHHTYANIDGWDTDMEQSGVLAIYPHVETNNVQRYQHWFCFLIYPTYLFNWLLVRDFRDYFDKSRVVSKVIREGIPLQEKMKLIAFKSFYIFYQIIVPIVFFGISWKLAVSAWMIQVLFASVFALFVLLPLHPLIDNQYPLPDKDGKLPMSWLRHQLEVTNDLTNDNWVVRNVLGSFNHHVAHHLFPNISHVYYPEITDELKKFAQGYGLRYEALPLMTALRRHYALLKSNARSTMRHVMEE